MKKLFVILVMTLLGYESIGAEKSPIMPRKANNGEYTQVEAEKIATGDGQVAVWWRTNFLMLMNKEMKLIVMI